MQDRRSSSGSLRSSTAEKKSDSDLNSDQDKAKDCNGRVVPKVVLERSATVIEVRAPSQPSHLTECSTLQCRVSCPNTTPKLSYKCPLYSGS